MTKFILKCICLLLGVAAFIVLLMFGEFFRMQRKIDAEYTLSPEQTVLFLGSSDTTFSISSEPKWHNKIITVYSSSVQSACARLLELERRGQLRRVKNFVLLFGYRSITSQNNDMMYFAWYNELPVTWRYLSLYPGHWYDYVKCVIKSLRLPFGFVIQQRPSEGLEHLPNRSASTKAKIYSGAIGEAKSLYDDSRRPIDWESSLKNAFKTMQSVCVRNDIRFSVVQTEVIKTYTDMLPIGSKSRFGEFVSWIELQGIEYKYLNCNYDDDEFYDAFHLNNNGQIKFTQRLYEAVQL